MLGILILGITSAGIFRLCRRQTDNDLLAIALTAITVAATSVHWFARPHLFSFLFLVVTLNLLEISYKNPKVLMWLPLMVILWTNLHGAFFVSIILLLTVAVGRSLESITAENSSGLGEATTAAKPYLVTAIACGVASLINPYGWNLHKHIVQYLSEKHHFQNIAEFQSLSFHSPVALFFEILLVLGLLAAGWSLLHRRFTDTLLLLSWLHMALMAGRNIPIFAILASPVIARFLTEGLQVLQQAPVAPWMQRAAAAITTFGQNFSRMDRIPRLHVTSAAAFAVLCILVLGASADASKWKAEFDPKRYPAAALSLLDGRRVFTNDEWGDYLIYRLHPNLKVFVDGRSDFYGDDFNQKYLDVLNGKWDWASILARHQVEAILLPVDAPLASTLKASTDWKTVFDDSTSILFFLNLR